MPPSRWRRHGSSPRMRGKRSPGRQPKPTRRIIPAHAGQTTTGRNAKLTAPDHPRACGANQCFAAVVQAPHGSSPRMRGKLGGLVQSGDDVRIIPAHAGQTDLPYGRAIESTDHPRACGANDFRHHVHGANAGSSPRMRGKLGVEPEATLAQRIIPAHAGQTQEEQSRLHPP